MLKILYLNEYAVYLDDEDYELISKMSGWYIQKEKYLNSNTNYVVHD